MNRALKVSIVITNYNYARFLREVIDSVLNQTYPHIEVIVVDDGSTDNSRDIIEAYGDRIISLFTENRGQRLAINTGFSRSSGDVVVFFDSDDVLLPRTVQRVVAAFESEPQATKVQYRLQLVDKYLKTKDEFKPSKHIRMPTGDLRSEIATCHSYCWAPLIGNAFSSSVLRQILPMPQTATNLFPDIYLCNLAPLYGPIVSIEEVGALYRIHGNNSYISLNGKISLDLIREEILQTLRTHIAQRDLLNNLYSANIREIGSRHLYLLTLRTISKKLDPLNHPVNESLLKISIRGCISSLGHPSRMFHWYSRLIYAVWFVAMLFVPLRWAVPLSEMALYPSRRGWIFNTRPSLVRKLNRTLRCSSYSWQ